jgi:phosphatidylglycerol:prolipoprotein diacylglycerol transferase
LKGIYHVSFPGLGIELEISPIAFYIFNHPVHWYGIIIAIGFALACIYVSRRSESFGIDPSDFMDVIVAGTILGIIGARLYYVIFYPGNDYIKNPLSALYIWDGGIAIYGAIIGGILGGIVCAREKNMSILSSLDLASLGFLIGQSIGRWGNFVNQEAFGTKTDLPWRMVSENTGSVPVHPCFLYESIFCAIGFFVLHFASKRLIENRGRIFSIYLIWYGLGRFFIESLRTDSLLIPGTPIKVSQAVALFAVIIGCIIMHSSRSRQKIASKKLTTDLP